MSCCSRGFYLVIKKENFLIKKGIDLFDDFYVNIYDDLFFREIVNQYEVGSIMNITKPTTESKILVIGSGTGHVADAFAKEGINIVGLDESHSMVKYAKDEYPALTFKQGSPLKTNTFNQNSFTHILCLNMNFYYYKDKKQFFQNVYDWLMPGGYFVVQLVDKNKFDPVVPAAKPFVMVNPQKCFLKKELLNQQWYLITSSIQQTFKYFQMILFNFKKYLKILQMLVLANLVKMFIKCGFHQEHQL